jgi:hypothetical protein
VVDSTEAAAGGSWAGERAADPIGFPPLPILARKWQGNPALTIWPFTEHSWLSACFFFLLCFLWSAISGVTRMKGLWKAVYPFILIPLSSRSACGVARQLQRYKTSLEEVLTVRQKLDGLLQPVSDQSLCRPEPVLAFSAGDINRSEQPNTLEMARTVLRNAGREAG